MKESTKNHLLIIVADVLELIAKEVRSMAEKNMPENATPKKVTVPRTKKANSKTSKIKK